MKLSIGKLLMTGIKLFVVLLLAGIVMAIPYGIVMYVMTKAVGIGMFLSVLALVLYFIVLGWVAIKFKSFYLGK